jgi:hypothetical protein
MTPSAAISKKQSTLPKDGCICNYQLVDTTPSVPNSLTVMQIKQDIKTRHHLPLNDIASTLGAAVSLHPIVRAATEAVSVTNFWLASAGCGDRW